MYNIIGVNSGMTLLYICHTACSHYKGILETLIYRRERKRKRPTYDFNLSSQALLALVRSVLLSTYDFILGPLLVLVQLVFFNSFHVYDYFSSPMVSIKGCRMGRSDKVSLWYVPLLINTRFRFFFTLE